MGPLHPLMLCDRPINQFILNIYLLLRNCTVRQVNVFGLKFCVLELIKPALELVLHLFEKFLFFFSQKALLPFNQHFNLFLLLWMLLGLCSIGVNTHFVLLF